MTTNDSGGKTIDLEGTIITQTDKDIFFNGGDRTAWLPKAQIDVEGPDKKRRVRIRCPEWLALEEGLIEEGS